MPTTPLVIETASVDGEKKKSILEKLDEFLSPASIIVTSCLAYSTTQMAAWTTNPERIVGFASFHPLKDRKVIELAAGIRDNVPAGTEDFDLPDVERPWEDDELPWGQDAKMADDLRLAVRLSHERGDRQWSRSRLAMMLPGDKATLLKRIQESVPDPPEEAEEVDGEVA